MTFLRTWEWPKLLEEYQRVTRPGGVIRITENHWLGETSSPALSRLNELTLKAFYQAGHSFAPKSDGVTSELPSLLARHGLESVQTRAFTLEYRAGTQGGEDFCKDMELVYRTGQPFLRKWVRLPDDYENLCQQALSEMRQLDFIAKWRMLTVWGTTRC